MNFMVKKIFEQMNKGGWLHPSGGRGAFPHNLWLIFFNIYVFLC
jgi:hypothetical protein